MTIEPKTQMIDARAGRDLSVLDLVSIDPLTLDDLSLIFDLARGFRAHRTYKFDLNKGCSVVNAFFESSTRTLSSFDLSAKNLSMDTNNVSASGTMNKKGEAVLDVIQTLDAYNLKTIIIRCAESGVPEMMARHTRAAIINAGDGWHEHPTQALLDALTMLDHFGGDLSGRVVTIVGDIMHSRVFGSLVRLLPKLGMTIRVAAPKTFIPVGIENFGVEVLTNVEEAIEGAAIVYALRVQEERGANGFIPSLREYSKQYGISKKRLDLAANDAILMHPGPVRRDIDVHSALVALDDRSQILQQVENGMAIRKTLLWLLANRMDDRVKEGVQWR